MRAPMLSGMAPRTRLALVCLGLPIALIASPAAARAQADARPVAYANVDARLAARLDSATLLQVARLLDEARGRRLPIEPLVDKALEGASKGKSRSLIVEAVRRLSGDLAESRRILGPEASAAEVTAGAHALRANLAPESLERLRKKRGRTTLIASLGVYQELVGLEVSPDTAAGAVVSLHEKELTAQELAGFQNEVARDIAVGGSPSMVAAIRTELMVGDGLVGANAPTLGSYVETRGGTTNNTRSKRKP